jgi:hypothetical protein
MDPEHDFASFIVAKKHFFLCWSRDYLLGGAVCF